MSRSPVRAKSVSVTATPKASAKKKRVPCSQCERCGGYVPPEFPGVFNAASYGHSECLEFYLKQNQGDLGWLQDVREYGTPLHFAAAYVVFECYPFQHALRCAENHSISNRLLIRNKTTRTRLIRNNQTTRTRIHNHSQVRSHRSGKTSHSLWRLSGNTR